MQTKSLLRFLKAASLGLILSISAPAFSQEENSDDGLTQPNNRQQMTAERLSELILNVDGDAVLRGTSWSFQVEGLDALVVYDILADRMRIVIPIIEASEVKPERMMRLMQANFDSALDARYAIAQGMLWGTYLHPLSTLTDEQFLVAIGQTANVVMSYGTSYSSGLFIFGSGDSAEIERQKLIERLKKQQT